MLLDLLASSPGLLLLQNEPGTPGYAPLRLIAAFFMILTVISVAALFTYWISKDE